MPNTHPTYDNSFRQEAVNLLLSSRRPLKTVAAELGVSANSLRTWRDRALHQGLEAQAGSARASGPKGRSVATDFRDGCGDYCIWVAYDNSGREIASRRVRGY